MNSNTVKHITAFQAQLENNIEAKIAGYRAMGIRSLPLDTLRSQTQAPSVHLSGAPLGTNALWVYGEMFADTVASLPGVYIAGSIRTPRSIVSF